MASMLPRLTIPFSVLCAVLFLLPAVTACAQEIAVSHSAIDEFHRRFNAELTTHGVVGGGFGLVRRGQPTHAFFAGEARRETHQPAEEDTAYNWASITKTMTAIAILQLRDRGRLSLDDPAVKYVPELQQVHDAYGSLDAVTIRDLLTHSAGFRNPTWPWDCDDAKD